MVHRNLGLLETIIFRLSPLKLLFPALGPSGEPRAKNCNFTIVLTRPNPESQTWVWSQIYWHNIDAEIFFWARIILCCVWIVSYRDSGNAHFIDYWPQSHKVTDTQGYSVYRWVKLFVPDFNKLPYSVCSLPYLSLRTRFDWQQVPLWHYNDNPFLRLRGIIFL